MRPNTAPHILTRAGLPRTEVAVPPPEDTGRARHFPRDLPLAAARAHEFCGTARRTLALAVAREMTGHIFWISPAWRPERLYGPAMARWIDPGRVVFFHPRRPEDILWTMEEALRSGQVPLVVADLPEPPALTPVRRLHLAAETGAGTGTAPLGIVMTPGPRGGAPGVETRWALTPAHGAGEATAWCLDRLRARRAAPAAWRATADPERGLRLVETLPVK